MVKITHTELGFASVLGQGETLYVRFLVPATRSSPLPLSRGGWGIDQPEIAVARPRMSTPWVFQ